MTSRERHEKSRFEDVKELLKISSDAGYESVAAESVAAESTPSKYGSLKNHVIIAVLTVWWTMGLGNLAYAAYCFYGFGESLDCVRIGV